MQGLDNPKLIFQALPVSLMGRVFNLVSNAERVPGDASLKRLKMGSSFAGGEDSPARSLIIAARANSKRLSCRTASLRSLHLADLLSSQTQEIAHPVLVIHTCKQRS